MQGYKTTQRYKNAIWECMTIQQSNVMRQQYEMANEDNIMSERIWRMRCMSLMIIEGMCSDLHWGLNDTTSCTGSCGILSDLKPA